MILLGAGSSVPFGIPAMKKFVELFQEKISDNGKLLLLFKSIMRAFAISENTIGYKITFDLESLMIVLQDLASDVSRPISLPTFAFMLGSALDSDDVETVYDIKHLRTAYAKQANELLARLEIFIFDICFEPIRKGCKEGGFRFLDFFYRPLFALIDTRIMDRQESWLFTTNWDLCLKQWLDYSQIPFEDGTLQDAHRKTVLTPSLGWTDSSTSVTRVVPLHGSFDLKKCTRLVSGKSYKEIEKVNDPEGYFRGNPHEISNAFIVYPIEAIGYAETIRSPYLDMLTKLKKRLRDENRIFVVGFSFRDSIIASIFDEVVREKLESQYPSNMKVILIDYNPDSVVENLTRQGYTNIANAITKVKVTFPETLKYENKSEIMRIMQTMLNEILAKMHDLDMTISKDDVNRNLKEYGLVI